MRSAMPQHIVNLPNFILPNRRQSIDQPDDFRPAASPSPSSWLDTSWVTREAGLPEPSRGEQPCGLCVLGLPCSASSIQALLSGGG